MMERVTTITAAEFVEQGYADKIARGECEVTNPLYSNSINHIEPINPNSAGWDVAITDTKSTYRTWSSVVLTVRWLDTAPAERDAEAMSNHDLKMWALNMENVDDKRVLLAIDRLITENASLQAELEAARKQLAAAVEMATAARKEIAELFDPEQRFDRSKDGRFVTETLNFADASLMLIEDIVKGETTPQPAPAVDGGQVGKYVVCRECDGTGKLFVPEARPTALPKLDSNGQSSPAGKLVAAVTIEEMSSTLLPDGHEVKGLGCFIEHEGQKLLFFESSVVSDLQHDLSVAKDRIAVLEQSEQMLLKRIKKLRSKSELDDGFIDHLTANNEDTQ